MDSCLKKWLINNNYFFDQKKQNETESHFLYDGGVVYLPEDKEYEFLKLYSIDLKNKVSLHYVEKRKAVYKYMIDLDIYDSYCWTDKEIIHISKIINSIINEFYNNKSNNNSIDLYCIVCKIFGHPKEKDGLVHSGIHIIYPKLLIDDKTALMFREAVLQKINLMINDDNLAPEKKPKNLIWADLFDARIYEANGFTMVGSCKIKEPNIRTYMPLTVLNKDGSVKQLYLERILNNYLDMMLDTSIRYIPEAFRESNIEGFGPTNIPEWVDKSIMDNMNVIKRKRGNKSSMTDAQDVVYQIVHSAILKHMPDYKHEPYLIKEIFRYPDNNGRPDNNGALLITTTSKYCMNLGREHKSCGIYFYANKNGICQKCLCPCNNKNGRKNGYCRDYTSDYYPFDTDLCVVLFGSKTNIKFREVTDDLETQLTGSCSIEGNKTQGKETQGKGKETQRKEAKEKTKKKPQPFPNEKYEPGMTSNKYLIEKSKKNCGAFLKKLTDLDNKQSG